MDDVLKHYGIIGQKWGIRRTPAQLGHVTGSKKSGDSVDESPITKTPKKTPGKSARKVSSMSDEELRQRISRLNMEEQYDNLVERQKQRNTGVVKKLLGEAAESLGRKALGLAIDKCIDKLKKDKFDIDDWKNADVYDMDIETIQKVNRWYQNAQNIKKSRDALVSKPTVSSEKEVKDTPSKPDTDKETNSQKTNTNTESSLQKKNTDDVFTTGSSNRSQKSTESEKLPWIYRESGTADAKKKERLERKRYKNAKNQYKWIG